VFTPADLTDAALEFLRERHLAAFTTMRADGTPHVVPVGFTWDGEAGIARVIASGTSQKARQAALGGPVALCQVDGRRWLTLEGVATVSSDPAVVSDAEARYTARYRAPRINPHRVAIEILVRRVLGAAEFRAG
jgi:PPOX class probable F420-dependent enzyme